MINFKIKIVDKEYTIKDENELSLIFSLIGKEKETNRKILYNVIMQLDNELENIIITYKGLINCLKVLDDNNSFLLLIKLGDVLSKILKSSSHLGEILARISLEKNKIRLLKSMRLKGLSSIINSTRDLGNIFEWIYEDGNNEVIDILGEDFIRKIFLSTYEIIIVLHYLSDKTNDRLIDILGLENIYKKIKTKENLLVLFSALTDNKAIELLNFFTKKEIKEMFNNQEEYYNFLLRLPYRKEKIFLNYLY